jgi:hypothetical protein
VFLEVVSPSRDSPHVNQQPTIVRSATAASGDRGTVLDIVLAGRGTHQEAYLVEPNAGSSGPGVLYFHWFEPHAADSSREEFVDEALALARRGVTSLLVQGALPWRFDPVDPDTDRRAILEQIEALRAGLDFMVEHGSPPSRLAVVGHDFGAMYGALLATIDRRPMAYVLMAATPRWVDWFAPYWQLAVSAEAYGAAMSDLDPITHVAQAAPARLLFQFARNDQRYVPTALADKFFQAASDPKELRWYATGHRLNRLARRERELWLLNRLGVEAE